MQYKDNGEAFGLPLKPHTHCHTIREWALGKPVQYLSKRRGYWVCTSSPSWREDTQYRVKPDETKDALKDEISDVL